MVMSSIIILAGLGFVAATILAVASRVFHVEEDPRVEAVLDSLPGVNCGGCGYAGCEGYAVAVVNHVHVAANLCVAATAEVNITVGELTGKIVTEAEPLRSFRRCDRLSGHVGKRYVYQGMPSCAAAATLGLGESQCAYSCLGYGDCVEICPFDAVYIENGLVQMDTQKCTGCGRCVRACPRCILELIPKRSRVSIMCATQDKMRAVMDVCKVGCIQCMKCVKACPAQALSHENGRVVVNQIKCLSFGPECEEICVTSCPRKILRSGTPRLLTDTDEDANAEKMKNETKNNNVIVDITTIKETSPSENVEKIEASKTTEKKIESAEKLEPVEKIKIIEENDSAQATDKTKNYTEINATNVDGK